MAFKDFPEHAQGVQLLQRSLTRGRLAHGYLFVGHQLGELETLARTLAKTLNCQHPVREGGVPIDCCDQCLACRKIEHGNHADVHWLRPESKLRLIKMDQMVDRPTTRETPLLDRINLKTFEAEYKVAVIVAADRMTEEAANAFLKTLEEPPAKTVLVLLTTEPQRILETIRSRCLRINFGANGQRALDPAQMEWLTAFSDAASAEQKSLLGRYRLMDVLSRKLSELRASVEDGLKARSPLEQYEEAEEDLRERWEKELDAAIEAEYRRQRADLLLALQWWLRDVWIRALGAGAQSPHPKPITDAALPPPTAPEALLNFPKLVGTKDVARRVSAKDAMDNLGIMEDLQRWLGTNVQEALALEVSLLKLHL